MSTPAAQSYTTGSVISADGNVFGYRQFGHGPGVILMHGGMEASQNFMRLGQALSDAFTVYLPDRRGRGLSGGYGDHYCIQRDVEDLDALLRQTGAQNVFGLSSGALICLNSALKLPAIRKLALYEPPLSVNHSIDVSWVARYDREVAEGKLPEAFVTIMKGIPVAPLMAALPRFISVPMLRMAMKDEDMPEGHDVPVRALIPTQHYDMQLVMEAEGTLDTFKAVSSDVLLLGGSKSPRFLKIALESLEQVLPHVRRLEMPGLDHLAPENDGKPEQVALELRRFFMEHD